MHNTLLRGFCKLSITRCSLRSHAHSPYAIQGFPPSRIVHNTLLRGYCKLGVVGQARAIELVQEMQAVSVMQAVSWLVFAHDKHSRYTVI